MKKISNKNNINQLSKIVYMMNEGLKWSEIQGNQIIYIT